MDVDSSCGANLRGPEFEPSSLASFAVETRFDFLPVSMGSTAERRGDFGVKGEVDIDL